MGQQQLLLIVLGLIIVGIAIMVGINVFTVSAVETKRDQVISECMNLASEAQQYYQKPSALGGGSRSFLNWQIPRHLRNTASGSYAIETVEDQQVVIVGTGNEVVTGSDSIQVRMTILPSDFQTQIVH